MADLSQFSFTGRLGSDATVKKLPSGKSVMEMSAAVNTGYGDYKKTLWVKIKVWGDRVNNIVGIFKKGAVIAASGEPELNSYTGNDGQTRTELVVTCMNVQIISSKKQDSSAEPEPEPEDGVVF